MAMRRTGHRTIKDGAGMAMEVVADLFNDTVPSDLCGYVVIGLLAGGNGGFKISSNAKGDMAEIFVLREVLAALEATAQ